jgi:hypothetical protein
VALQCDPNCCMLLLNKENIISPIPVFWFFRIIFVVIADSAESEDSLIAISVQSPLGVLLGGGGVGGKRVKYADSQPEAIPNPIPAINEQQKRMEGYGFLKVVETRRPIPDVI